LKVACEKAVEALYTSPKVTEELMIAEMSVAARALTVVGVVLWSSPIFAQAPRLVGDVFYPTGLSFDRCLQGGQAALRDIGSKNATTQTIFTGMGWVFGTIGNFQVSIACVTAKDVIVFSAAGPDEATAGNYALSLRQKMLQMRHENPG
jgi:hypothetical protein